MFYSDLGKLRFTCCMIQLGKHHRISILLISVAFQKVPGVLKFLSAKDIPGVNNVSPTSVPVEEVIYRLLIWKKQQSELM